MLHLPLLWVLLPFRFTHTTTPLPAFTATWVLWSATCSSLPVLSYHCSGFLLLSPATAAPIYMVTMNSYLLPAYTCLLLCWFSPHHRFPSAISFSCTSWNSLFWGASSGHCCVTLTPAHLLPLPAWIFLHRVHRFLLTGLPPLGPPADFGLSLHTSCLCLYHLPLSSAPRLFAFWVACLSARNIWMPGSCLDSRKPAAHSCTGFLYGFTAMGCLFMDSFILLLAASLLVTAASAIWTSAPLACLRRPVPTLTCHSPTSQLPASDSGGGLTSAGAACLHYTTTVGLFHVLYTACTLLGRYTTSACLLPLHSGRLSTFYQVLDLMEFLGPTFSWVFCHLPAISTCLGDSAGSTHLPAGLHCSAPAWMPHHHCCSDLLGWNLPAWDATIT